MKQKKIPYQIQLSHFTSEFDLNSSKEKADLNFTTSIYLPPREAEYLHSLIKNGWNLREFLKHSLKKHGKILLRNSGKRTRITKRIQDKSEKKERFCFRPDPSIWVEVQMMSLGIGVSCCIVVLELLQLHMNELLNKFIEKMEDVGISTSLEPTFRSFTFQYFPKHSRVLKQYTYCRGTIYKSPPN